MRILKTLSGTAKLALEESLHGTLALHVFILLVHTALSTGGLALEKSVIDRIRNIDDNNLTTVIVFIVGFFLLKNALNVVYTIRYLIAVSFGPRLDFALRAKMIDKISKLNLIYFEDAELFTLIEKARNATYYAVHSFTTAYHTILSHGATVFGVTIYLSFLQPSFVLIIFFAAIPKVLNFIYRGRMRLQLENTQAPLRRQYDYYNSCLNGRELYKETRLFGSFHYFKNLWANSLELLNELEWKNALKLLPMELLLNLTNFLAYIGTLALAVVYLSAGEISLGAFAVVLSALSQLDDRIEKILNNGRDVVESSAIAQNYFTFMELDEKNSGTQSAKVHPIESIRFENVNFTYPSVQHDVIRNLSLTIKKGETIAIVGLNGAGKTTFVKLLLGLLTPTSGQVFYNEIDIATLKDQSLHPGTSALFQTFGKYMMSVRENVTISDTQKKAGAGDVEKCLEFVNFPLNGERFPEGLETQLGKEFGGTELSGGQWQLLALARAYFRGNDLIILDEPTAAIDPLVEDQIFKNFHTICTEKTAIIVTHRLGVAKIADRIIVFDRGTIIEDGSHADLLAAGGRYAELYTGQSNWYQRSDSVE